MGKVGLEIIARITLPDGRVIERTVDAGGDIPTPDDFDVSSKDGFLKSFDALEKAVLEARNQAGECIAEAYLEEVSKKNG